MNEKIDVITISRSHILRVSCDFSQFEYHHLYSTNLDIFINVNIMQNYLMIYSVFTHFQSFIKFISKYVMRYLIEMISSKFPNIWLGAH